MQIAALINIHDHAAVDAWARHLRVDRHYVRLLRNAFYKQFRGEAAAIDCLPPPARERAATELQFRTLTLAERRSSQLDGAEKLLLRTADGLLIEAVILSIASGRTTLCLSSQVGCAAKCGFCATGQMGLTRNLTTAEIVDQLLIAGELCHAQGRRIRNVVFMGMGEPLHNAAEVFAALELMQSVSGFHLAPRRILVSTVGIPDAMLRCAERFPKIHLALSLHSARPETRAELIPISRRHDLPELRRALQAVTQIQGQPVMIEYLLLAGVNDQPADLEALIEYLTDLPVHINLIPYNPIDDADSLRGTPPAQRQQFAQALKQAGFKVTLRYSLGADIAAACGQLVRRENRRRQATTRDESTAEVVELAPLTTHR